MLPALENTTVLGLRARWVLIVVVLVITVAHLGLRVSMVPQYRTELGGVEHNSVHAIQKALLDLPLYQDPEHVPFDVIQYTPAYFVVCASIGTVLGIEGNDARASFLLSRTVALCLTLLTCWVVYSICLSAGASKWSAVVALGLVCCAYTEHFYSRPDALQSFASLGAVLVFVRWLKTSRPSLLIATAGLAALGFFAKQSGVMMILIPALFLVIDREWRAFQVYFAAALGFLAFGFVLMFTGTTPHIVWQNTVQGLANGYSTMMWGELFEPATYKYFIGWHLLALLLIIQGFRSKDPVLRFFALAIPLAITFGLLTGLKSGSRMNYLHEGMALTFIGTAIFLRSSVNYSWKSIVGWTFAGYGLIFMAFRTKSLEHWAHVDDPESTGQAEYRSDLAVRDVLLNELHLKPNQYIFITYREYLEHLLVKQSVMKQQDIVKFSSTKLYDYSAFHRAMQDGTIRFVITEHPERPLSFLDSTFTGWVPIRSVEGRTILARTP